MLSFYILCGGSYIIISVSYLIYSLLDFIEIFIADSTVFHLFFNNIGEYHHLSSYDLKFPSKSFSSLLHGVNSINSSRQCFCGSFCFSNYTLLKTLALERLHVFLFVVLKNSSSTSSFCSSSIYFRDGRP